ncbi:3-carboxy-cis,cis-muconate cycloisomerase [Sulfitobacter sp. SK012]|uniref:3-carboxy-cis,cis-muconate cycloisomerase n=1 Tax=Sulfitobacter sp. SK012 TaxID=1389005 RepID=UPI000E0A7CB4|nr:3-carboxy-cis,cis-muconate cycloisomerase [Sulfitobacter sp. SK012]AXI48414.1 3-carboxy-cis,cis-muconate cycloisomerase [Sulfitobacter sp. SK012]
MSNAFTRTGLFGQLFQDGEVADAFSAEIFVSRMITFERAWTQALARVGVVDQASESAALAAIDAFTPDFSGLSAASDVDGLPLPNLVSQLRAGMPEPVQKAVHTGTTSQDVIDTAMIMTCQHLLSVFAARGAAILVQLDGLDDAFGNNAMMGRTRMQAALPITVHDRLRIWRGPLAQQLHALTVLIEQSRVLQAGGAVGLRDKPQAQADAVATHVADTLGLKVVPLWHADRSAILDLGNWLVKTAGLLGKLGQDIALMAQQGVDEVALEGAGGSSAMPHKQNPIRAEALVTLGRFVAGQQGVLGQSMIHEQERSGAAWALEWMTLPLMFEATGASLNNAAVLLSQIRRLGGSAG